LKDFKKETFAIEQDLEKLQKLSKKQSKENLFGRSNHDDSYSCHVSSIIQMNNTNSKQHQMTSLEKGLNKLAF
jgi:hypothetical protein